MFGDGATRFCCLREAPGCMCNSAAAGESYLLLTSLLDPIARSLEWDSLNFSTRARYNRLIDFSPSLLLPSYSARISEITAPTGAAHVGVQMRHMKTATNRNSDVEFMLSAAGRVGSGVGTAGFGLRAC